MKTYKITKKENLPDSMFVIEVEISAEGVAAERKAALDKFQNVFAIDGFRKGHIPEKILVEKVGELGITEESGSLAVEKNYEAIMTEVGVAAIGQPKVSIIKIAPGQPLEFRIETAIIPEVKVPNYKKIAKEVMSKEDEITVDDKDVETAIKEIRESVAHQKFHQEHGDSEHHDHDFSEENLPALTDEWVKTLGAFDNVEDFKKKLAENLVLEKKGKAREKKRIETMEAIIKDTVVEIPAVLVESELLKLIGQLKDSVSNAGLSFDEYLKRISKTEEDIRAEWKDEAKKRAIMQLVLNKISTEQKIEVSEEEVKHQSEQLMTYYKDADPLRVRIYVENMMMNEKVWKFLEEQR